MDTLMIDPKKFSELSSDEKELALKAIINIYGEKTLDGCYSVEAQRLNLVSNENSESSWTGMLASALCKVGTTWVALELVKNAAQPAAAEYFYHQNTDLPNGHCFQTAVWKGAHSDYLYSNCVATTCDRVGDFP